MERSLYTNSLHTSLSNMLLEMRELAEDGVEDELDPACVKLFGRTRDFARSLSV